MADLADRVIVDSAAREDREETLREMAAMIGTNEIPAIGDLQWVGLSPWRSLLADAFGSPERVGELEKIESGEILYAPGGECRALLLLGWLDSPPTRPTRGSDASGSAPPPTASRSRATGSTRRSAPPSCTARSWWRSGPSTSAPSTSVSW